MRSTIGGRRCPEVLGLSFGGAVLILPYLAFILLTSAAACAFQLVLPLGELVGKANRLIEFLIFSTDSSELWRGDSGTTKPFGDVEEEDIDLTGLGPGLV